MTTDKDILHCPICNKSIRIISNNYKCTNCNSNFPIEDGIGILVPSPTEHISMINKKIEGITGDWYSADQVKSYEKGPYYNHLQKRKKFVTNILEEINKKNKINNLLDLGCGDGSNLKWISKFSQNLYGTDYNLLRLKRAKKILDKIKISSKLFLTDIFSMPFIENSFDLIFFNHVIEHLEDDKLALKKIFEITKKGGYVILGTPNEGALAWKFAYYIESNVKRKTDHVNFYTANSIKKISEEAGFTVEHIEYMGWGIPIWKIDPLFRKYKIFDDLFESIGKKIFRNQATSLYLILKKNN